MNRFEREIEELAFGLYRDDTCARICAIARALGITPAEFNASEMNREIYYAEQDLLHFVMKSAAAHTLGIEVSQLAKTVRAAHALTEYFQWGSLHANGEDYPESGPMFVSPDGVEFVLPVFGEDNSLIYEDFPGFKYWMSSEHNVNEWYLNTGLISGMESILDFLEDEDISNEVADAVFIAFSDCVCEGYIHPSMIDVCRAILRHAWSCAA